MRLLHTSTLKLYEFYGDDIPPYAILSHTWGKAEVSLHDLQNKKTKQLSGLEGYLKIKACCALAAQRGWKYVWIDTCCIDKTSSAELSEAINSMYRWYQNARVCYAYLVDVCIEHGFCTEHGFCFEHGFCIEHGFYIEHGVCIEHRGLWSSSEVGQFRKSRWFTRGWTLQELLAPKDVVFYDKDWRKFGSKYSLKAEITIITGIQENHMMDTSAASAAQKMSWASGRKTTRVEDMAYSLMGIFDVNMPLLYGEGEKAFTRLQHEIVKISNDESIFAWTDNDLAESGMFARSPEAFSKSGDIVRLIDRDQLYVHRAPYAVTNRGLALEISDAKRMPGLLTRLAVPLNCKWESGPDPTSVQKLVAIEIKGVYGRDFVRSAPWRLTTRWPEWLDVIESDRVMYIRPSYVLSITPIWLFINLSLLLGHKFSILATYGCHQVRHPWFGQLGTKWWRISCTVNQTCIAILFQSSPFDCRQTFGVILNVRHHVESIDLRIPLTKETIENMLQEFERKQFRESDLPHGVGVPVSGTLQDNSRISVILKKRRAPPGERHYSLEFNDT